MTLHLDEDAVINDVRTTRSGPLIDCLTMIRQSLNYWISLQVFVCPIGDDLSFPRFSSKFSFA